MFFQPQKNNALSRHSRNTAPSIPVSTLKPNLIWSLPPGSASDGEPDSGASSGGSAVPSELELRAGFFREQWEVSGPGQTAKIAAAIGLAEPAPVRIQLVMPVHGLAAGCLDSFHCWCTAALHDVDPAIPEILRLTWVISTALVQQRRGCGRSATQYSAGPGFPSGDPVFAVPAALPAAAVTLLTAFEFGLISGLGDRELLQAGNLWFSDSLAADGSTPGGEPGVPGWTEPLVECRVALAEGWFLSTEGPLLRRAPRPPFPPVDFQ